MLTVRRAGTESLTTAAVAGVAGVVCCAGLPLIATFLGGIALAAVLGVAVGVLAVAALTATAIAVVRARRRGDARRAARSRLP